jgi:hypothetical protein
MKCLLAFVDTSNTSLFVFLYGCYLCAQRRDAMQVSDCLFDHSALYIHIESTYKNKSQIRPSALSPRTAILKSTQLTFEVGWRNTTPVAFRHSLSSTSLPSTATRHTIQSTTKIQIWMAKHNTCYVSTQLIINLTSIHRNTPHNTVHNTA